LVRLLPDLAQDLRCRQLPGAIYLNEGKNTPTSEHENTPTSEHERERANPCADYDAHLFLRNARVVVSDTFRLPPPLYPSSHNRSPMIATKPAMGRPPVIPKSPVASVASNEGGPDGGVTSGGQSTSAVPEGTLADTVNRGSSKLLNTSKVGLGGSRGLVLRSVIGHGW